MTNESRRYIQPILVKYLNQVFPANKKLSLYPIKVLGRLRSLSYGHVHNTCI